MQNEHIKWETFQTRASLHFSVRRESNERGNGPVLEARAGARVISYQITKETMCMQCRSYVIS